MEVAAMLLLAAPKRWLSWDYEVRDAFGRRIGDVRLSLLGARGTITVGETRLSVSRLGFLFGPLVLSGPLGELGRATRLGLFARGFSIEHDGRSLVLRTVSIWFREMRLFDGGLEIGKAVPEGVFSRRAQVELPESLSAQLQLFVIWLALYTWRQAQGSSSSFTGALQAAPRQG
jgi:hypothetical protein